MSDAYIYLFTRFDTQTGTMAVSNYRATLEAIRGRGEPVMETQLVVDDSELDNEGCLHRRVASPANASDMLAGEINSLRCRAESRDRAAISLGDNAGDARYMLRLESRELRKQMIVLQRLHGELNTGCSIARSPVPELSRDDIAST